VVKALEFIINCLHPIGISYIFIYLKGFNKEEKQVKRKFLNVLLVVTPLDNLPITLSMAMGHFLGEARMQQGT
jgi:hypothetical protein